ncbi:hypothetical protein ACFL2J_01565 [Candidatus Omnitrophota bacterium]
MKKKILVYSILITSISLLYFGCQPKTGPGKVVAKINNYKMTQEDLEDKMVHSPYSSEMAKDLGEFLDIAIREQVLIQEAQKQGLDREKTFMKTIERYWMQTLVKELLDKHSRKIYKGVSENKQEAAMDAWVEELYKKADIKIYNKVLDEMKQN